MFPALLCCAGMPACFKQHVLPVLNALRCSKGCRSPFCRVICLACYSGEPHPDQGSDSVCARGARAAVRLREVQALCGEAIASLTTLQELALADCGTVHAEALLPLAQLSGLSQVRLTDATQDAVAALDHMPALVSLALHARVSAAAVRCLCAAPLASRLTCLELPRSQATSGELVAAERMDLVSEAETFDAACPAHLLRCTWGSGVAVALARGAAWHWPSLYIEADAQLSPESFLQPGC